MRREKYQFGEYRFTSQQAVRKLAANIRNNYVPFQTIDNPKHIAFLLDLLRDHNESDRKSANGIKRFYHAPAPDHPNTNCFYIERNDGSNTDWGIASCLQTIRSINFESFRMLVRRDIAAYKNQRLIGCEVTFVSDYSKKIFPVEEAHIDHITPFKEIVDLFCAQEKIDIDARLLTKSSDMTSEPVWIAPSVATRFREYHSKQALQLVHSKENLSDLKILRNMLS